MAHQTVSKEAIATRRRALGRRLVQKASNLMVDVAALDGSPDLQYLTQKERDVLEKQLKTLAAIHINFNKMGQHLEKSE